MQALASLCSFLQLEILFQACIFVARMEFLLLVELRLLFTCWLENRAHSQILHVCMLSHVQLSCEPMSPPGSSVHGFSRQKCCSGLPFPPLCHSPLRKWTHISWDFCIGRWILCHLSHRGSLFSVPKGN